MRITTLLLFLGCLQLSAASFSQTVTLSVRRQPLADVLNSIREQTGFYALLNQDMARQARPVTVQLNDIPLPEALAVIFKDQPLSYQIDDKMILVSRKVAGSDLVLVKPGAPAAQPSQPPTITLSGTVTDSTGHPIPAATIRVLKNNLGVSANEAGGFIFANVPDDAIIHISSVGYEALDINVADLLSGNTATLTSLTFKKIGINVLNLDIILTASQNTLEDVKVSVVNTGYQKIKPEQSTGAVSVITTKEYESRISTNFLDGLMNKLPGLMINNDVKFNSNVNGTTSSNSLFNIRGISTMTANQSPLIVVDGYPTELSLNMIDPDEIKSVTILKDAAAATVYGVRASNGVIVVERKQASRGKPQIVFRTTVGVTPKENYTHYRWAKDASGIAVDYLRDLNKTSVNQNTWATLSTLSNGFVNTSPFYIMAQQAAGLIGPEEAERSFDSLRNYNNAADYSNLFLRTAATQTDNLNLSGGSESASYYITANYTSNALQQIRNNNNRLLLSARTDLIFSPRFSLQLTTDYEEEHYRAAPVPDINSIYPYERLQDANGNPLPIMNGSGINPYYNQVLTNLGLYDQLYYPLTDINEVSDKTHTVNDRITANFSYRLAQGFDLSFGGIYETSRSDIRHNASERSSEARQYVNSYASQAIDESISFTIPKGGFLQQQTANTTSYTVRAQLNYDKHLGRNHTINGILGTEIRDVTAQQYSTANFGYNDQSLLQQAINYADIVNRTVQRNLSITRSINYVDLFKQQYLDNRFLSGYANLVYSFKSTYSLSGSMRIDQSNLFGTNPKYKYKPLWSVSGAWNINKEAFMKEVQWVKLLKLRVADGFNGNVAKLSLPQVIAQATINTLTYPASNALQLTSNANSSLRWEQTHSRNVGLDYGIFRGINGTIDYYVKNSTDLLADAYVDPTIGANHTKINSASIRNEGLEFSLHADWITKQRFNWNTGLVMARNTSNVQGVYQNLANSYYPLNLNSRGYLKGYPVGALFAYYWAGLDAKGNPQARDQRTGNVYAVGDVSTGTTTNLGHITGDTSGTFRYMGSSIPTVNAGLSNRVDIGNFYIYCMINYYGGFKVFVPRPDPTVLRPLIGSGNYWKQPGDEQHTDVMSSAASLYGGYIYPYSDKYLVNGDYLTLGDLTVSYSFNNSDFLRRTGFRHCELKLQASNLWTVGLNKYNYSAATGSYAKSYLTPTYTLALFTNF